MQQSNDTDKNDILYISFNQDASCFAFGTQEGFKIYKTYPLNDKYEKKMKGGLEIVEMYYNTNLLALVGGGKLPKWNKNEVIIWDDYKSKIVAQLKFTTYVINVKFKKDVCFIITNQNIFLFSLKNFQNIITINTDNNINGLFTINGSPDKNLISYIKKETDGDNINTFLTVSQFNDEYKMRDIHIDTKETKFSYLCLNYDGGLLAVVNEDETKIKIFNSYNGQVLQECKRNQDKAYISYITFSNDSKLIAVTTDNGILQVWSLTQCLQNNSNSNDNLNNNLIPKNKASLFRFLPIDFFKGDMCFSNVNIGEESKCICAFVSDYSIIIISSSGKYYRCVLNSDKGIYEIQDSENLFNNITK